MMLAILSAITALPALVSDVAALFTAVVTLFHSEQANEVAQAARNAVSAAEATYQPLTETGLSQEHVNSIKREFAVKAVTGLTGVQVPEHQARVAVEMAVAEHKQNGGAIKA